MRLGNYLTVIAGLVLTSVVAAGADAIQKWRTAEGTLFFGDHPPPGSTLLETLPDSPVTVIPTDETTDLGRAAAEGRDIIRRREVVRDEERKRDAERQAWVDQTEASVEPGDYYDPPLWIATTPPCAPGERCFDGGAHDGHRHHGRHHDREDWRSGADSRPFPWRMAPPPAVLQDDAARRRFPSNPSWGSSPWMR